MRQRRTCSSQAPCHAMWYCWAFLPRETWSSSYFLDAFLERLRRKYVTFDTVTGQVQKETLFKLQWARTRMLGALHSTSVVINFWMTVIQCFCSLVMKCGGRWARMLGSCGSDPKVESKHSKALLLLAIVKHLSHLLHFFSSFSFPSQHFLILSASSPSLLLPLIALFLIVFHILFPPSLPPSPALSPLQVSLDNRCRRCYICYT